MTNKPTKKIGCGAVSVAVWANEIETANGTKPVERVTVDRRYKDKDGEWKSTGSFDTNDVPKLILGLQKAYEHMVCRAKDDENDGGGPE